MDIINTSYDQSYVIVSKTSNSVTLRLVDNTELYSTYWKKFIDGKIVESDYYALYIVVTDAPDELVRVNQFTPYQLSYPTVVLRSPILANDINLTKYVTSNKPSEELAGLFSIDYHLKIESTDSLIWKSFLSIEEPPLMRRSITTWNRSNYVIQTLNRLVIEPTFIDACHRLNQVYGGYSVVSENKCIDSIEINKYNVDFIKVLSEDTIFISSDNELPLSSKVVTDGYEINLDYVITCPSFNELGKLYFDHDLNACNYKLYDVGDVVSYAGKTWTKISSDASVNPTDDGWKSGIVYRASRTDSEPLIPTSDLVEPEKVLVKVDSNGYIFLVDLTKIKYQFNYRGYYDQNYYEDYNTNDILTYISENVVYLIRRLNTDIYPDNNSEHPPISNKNPNWSILYSISNNHEFDSNGIKFISNSTNAYISKNYSVSEYMCRVYAKLLRIPDRLVELIGTKSSVVLYNLLTRTRNTYKGLKLALQSAGLDISSLNLSDPSYEYETYEESTDEGDVYSKINTLDKIRKSISHLRTSDDKSIDKEGDLRYLMSDDGSSSEIQEFNGSEWKSVYKFVDTENALANNAIYKADLELLDRISKDATEVIDELTYISDPSSFTKVANDTDVILKYEIPIYIMMHIRLNYLEKACMSYYGNSAGFMDDGGHGCDKDTLIIHEYAKYDVVSNRMTYNKCELWDYEDPDNPIKIEPTTISDNFNPEFINGIGSKSYVYEFTHHPQHLRILPENNSEDYDQELVGYWRSVNTLGNLFSVDQDSSDSGELTETDILEVTDMDADLTLANGIVEVTPIYSSDTDIKVSILKVLTWNYILSDDGSGWVLKNNNKFTSILEYRSNIVDMDQYINVELSDDYINANRDKLINSIDYLVDENGSGVTISKTNGYVNIIKSMSHYYLMYDSEDKYIGKVTILIDNIDYPVLEMENVPDNLVTLSIRFVRN